MKQDKQLDPIAANSDTTSNKITLDFVGTTLSITHLNVYDFA